jgi:prepilin-type N-terminal cleavage/methylation domain-containing protein
LRLNKYGFTLIEVMISLVIISIALVALSSSQGIALNSTRKSRFITMATFAAKNKMADIDLLSTLKGFSYVKDMGEKTEGDFEEEEYKGWKWVTEVKEVKFPISAIMNSFLGGGGEGGEGNNSNASTAPAEGQGQAQAGTQEGQMLSMVGKNIETFMKQSVREVTVTVMWPVRGGQEFSNLKLVYYVVDYNAVQTFAPVM